MAQCFFFALKENFEGAEISIEEFTCENSLGISFPNAFFT